MTANQARRLRTFKAEGKARGSALTFVQQGGVLDRGSYIDRSHFSGLPPLNVGDEYVLFLTRNQQGLLEIHGSGAGAFVIRNGRVEPLGTGDVAQAWKGRSTAKFFEALATRLRR